MEVTIRNAEVVDKEEKEEKYDQWEIDDAYRTLKRAEEIKNDPELMGLVSACYDKDVKALNSLSSLKKLANKVSAKEADDMED